ncbi:MAG: uracil-DNA glycosylase family protein [Hyphomicrobium sp.]|nr:uracil-DNA glycosylase family protein [Hyphomicrobium sp.]MBN9268377.1 uracil-DNA glycosylase family protein [Hyphomicrobium sp.]
MTRTRAARPRRRALDALVEEIRTCRRCRDAPQGVPLPHEPRPVLRVSTTARIGVFGQAPGTRVHASGMPFTDPSGVRLRQWMGVTDEEFYDATRIAIIPMGFCFPGLDAKGGDLPPRRECAPLWRARLMATLPKLHLVLLVGQYAQRWHLGDDCARDLTGTVQRWREFVGRPDGPVMVPLPHPSWRNNAWIKRNPWFDAELLPWLKATVRSHL